MDDLLITYWFMDVLWVDLYWFMDVYGLRYAWFMDILWMFMSSFMLIHAHSEFWQCTQGHRPRSPEKVHERWPSCHEKLCATAAQALPLQASTSWRDVSNPLQRLDPDSIRILPTGEERRGTSWEPGTVGGSTCFTGCCVLVPATGLTLQRSKGSEIEAAHGCELAGRIDKSRRDRLSFVSADLRYSLQICRSSVSFCAGTRVKTSTYQFH